MKRQKADDGDGWVAVKKFMAENLGRGRKRGREKEWEGEREEDRQTDG